MQQSCFSSLCASGFPFAELSAFPTTVSCLEPLPILFILLPYKVSSLPLSPSVMQTSNAPPPHTHQWPSGSLCNSVPRFPHIQTEWEMGHPAQTLGAFCDGGWGGSGLTWE